MFTLLIQIVGITLAVITSHYIHECLNHLRVEMFAGLVLDICQGSFFKPCLTVWAV